ncbi:rhodanese-like domain-containing protein [Kangiella marina]|uniref:Rhodanese domain-containing protein n=1 Tax=Kangiella marina TaxID=1079178 RepID=A0ABP8IBE6_9GAMM
MTFTRLLIIMSITLIALGCRSEALTKNSSELPRDFTLAAGEKVLVNDMGFQFERVKQDSRCPKGAQCIQQGRAEVVINYTLDKTPIQKVMSIGGKDAGERLSVNGMTVQLGYLKPYPATNIKINPANYKAHFIVMEGAELDNAVVMDVRTQQEFDAGHYPQATHIPYDDISDRASELSFAKDDLVVVYCRSGNRAGKAKATLNQLGYTNVINGVDQDTVESLIGEANQ